MKVHTKIINPVLRAIASNAPTLLFCIGLIALCVGVAHWSRPAALTVAGVTLMVIGALAAYLNVYRGIHPRKE